jgi:dTDP-4-dehydrorhamnose reductase
LSSAISCDFGDNYKGVLDMSKTKVLVLGATGMLGHVLFKQLSINDKYEVTGTTRSNQLDPWFSAEEREHIRYKGGRVEAENFDSITRAIASAQPDVVINCIGIIKQSVWAQDPLESITVNSLFPHRLSLLCSSAGARLVHISTDCIFDGVKGNYADDDHSNATDLYGRTKYLGEVNYDHCITLRTSIIGHELRGFKGLIDWFLMQEGTVNGFTKALFSGFPTIEISNIISDYIIPNHAIKGVYNVSADPISKYDLLKLVAKIYDKKIDFIKDEDFILDRSLDSSRFKSETGYTPPDWTELVNRMYEFYNTQKHIYNK